jgi:hypothetical protein
VFHDVRWPGRRRANLDHVVVGPPGVFVVDTKNWSGRIEVRVGVLRQDGRSREKAVTGVADAARALADRLPSIDPAHVHPVLCFVTDEPLTGWARDVMVCSTATVNRLLLSRAGADLPTTSLVMEVGAAVRDAEEEALRLAALRPATAGAATGTRRARRSVGRRLVAAVALLALAAGAVVLGRPFGDWVAREVGGTADAADPCAALHATYPHGVGRRGALDLVAEGEQRVADFARRPKVYRQHRDLDTDGDGIACER